MLTQWTDVSRLPLRPSFHTSRRTSVGRSVTLRKAPNDEPLGSCARSHAVIGMDPITASRDRIPAFAALAAGS
jgi:hypothetical protein